MLVGALLDVSGSMESSLNLEQHVKRHETEEKERIHTIFSTLLKICEEHQNSNDELFAIVFGLKNPTGIKICDLMELISFQSKLKTKSCGWSDLIRLAAQNHAPNASEYIQKYLSSEEAQFLYEILSKDYTALMKVIDGLPLNCKDGLTGYGSSYGLATFKFFGVVDDSKAARDHIHRTKSLAMNSLFSRCQPKPVAFDSVVSLLRSNSSSSSFSSRKLLADITPYIYGETPLCEALRCAREIFASSQSKEKILYILSDGAATDGDPIPIARKIKENKVTIFSCLLTDQKIPEPRRLYDTISTDWPDSQKAMFSMSSKIPNSHPAFTVFQKKKWILPLSGETHLFAQVNHPEIVDEFASIIREVQDESKSDALVDILGAVQLDIYINSSVDGFGARQQEGGTCYANAIAAVFHLAMKRIVGRIVPEFETIRAGLIKQYSIGEDGKVDFKKGANTESVLREQCRLYRLRWLKVDEKGAREALNKRRCVVARFRLPKQGWERWGQFFQDPKKKRTPLDLSDLKTTDTEDGGGHAVVLVRCSAEKLTFMNSWGDQWADNGFFHAKSGAVLKMEFFDIFWYEQDLTKEEKLAYAEHSKKVVQTVSSKTPKALHDLLYKCPRCSVSSRCGDYEGTVLNAICPTCRAMFKPTIANLLQSLYLR